MRTEVSTEWMEIQRKRALLHIPELGGMVKRRFYGQRHAYLRCGGSAGFLLCSMVGIE